MDAHKASVPPISAQGGDAGRRYVDSSWKKIYMELELIIYILLSSQHISMSLN